MFFFRREQGLKRKMARRIRSPRGSAYLQFALVLPIVVMVVSAVIEFTALWDAKIMANHAAWTVGRIMTARAGLRDPKNASKSLLAAKPSSVAALLDVDKQTDGAYVATALLMSTCSMGSMHGSSADLAKDWAKKWVAQLTAALQKKIEDLVKSKLNELADKIKEKLPSEMGDNFIGKIVSNVVTWIQESVLTPLVNKLTEFVVGLLPQSAFDRIGELLGQQRQLRQIVYAADRVATYDVIQVKERDDRKIPAFSRQTMHGEAGRKILDYPSAYDDNAKSDDWMVTQAGGWPPNGQSQKMIDVTIKWPFERAWMFPVLAPGSTASASNDMPMAVGRALFYPQPAIFNENLASEGGTAFDPGEDKTYPKDFDNLKSAYAGFLHVALLSYRYRLFRETVGPYDSESSWSASYKGIGRGITGEAYESAYHEKTGLVFWMDRAPDDTGSHKAWKSKSPPADYYACFKALLGTGDETCYFFGASKKYLRRLENCRYRAYDWFYWGDGTTLHERHRHKAPGELAGAMREGDDVDLASYLYREAPVSGSARLAAYPSKGDFEGAVRQYGLSQNVVGYDVWKGFAQRNASFSPCANALVAMNRAGDAASLVSRESAVWTGTFVTLTNLNARIRVMMENGIDELAATLDGKDGGGATYSDSDFFDFGGDDEEIMKDPEKAVEKIREKLDNLKTTIIADVCAIDEAERGVRTAYAAFESALRSARATRQAQLKEWAAKTAAAMALVGGEFPPADVAQALLSSVPVKSDLAAPTQELETKYAAYRDALTVLYNAELKMAQDLGLKSSKDTPPLTPGVDPDLPDMPDITPDHPDESSPQSGSDDDGLGDRWKRVSGADGHGWIKN